jgi:hypothetical protein
VIVSRRSVQALSLALLLGLLTTGCGLVPNRPDAEGWTVAARQSLEDAASEVATVRVATEQQQKGRQLGAYGVVTATTSEEALGKAADSILAQQPPASRRDALDRVSQALGDAGDLVSEARIALVRGDEAEYDGLVKRLAAMSTRLDDLRASL